MTPLALSGHGSLVIFWGILNCQCSVVFSWNLAFSSLAQVDLRRPVSTVVAVRQPVRTHQRVI